MPFLRSCCFTGYRPEKYSFDPDGNSSEAAHMQTALALAVNDLIDRGIKVFYHGGARGFDLIAAETVLEASRFNPVRLVTVLPFPEFSDSWSPEWYRRLNHVIKNSTEVITCSEAYHRGAYAKRNRYLVDHSDCVLTYFDGVKGGTANTLAYAEKQHRVIINLADEHPVIPPGSEADGYPIYIVGQLPFCD